MTTHDTDLPAAALRWQGGVSTPTEDRVATEVAVALNFNQRPHVVMMMTPADIDAFTLGFSLTESIIAEPAELLHVEVHDGELGIQVDARVPPARALALDDRQRALAGRTGCGICGTRTLEAAMRSPPILPFTARIAHDGIGAGVAELLQRQRLNLATGGVHAAAWLSPAGALTEVCEDIGRHNALDKCVGRLAQRSQEFSAGALLLTSRASHELVLKAATVGVQVLIALSAPTSLAIRQADRCGMTLAAFAREGRHTVYAHAGRLT
jgi:FdhD protein